MQVLPGAGEVVDVQRMLARAEVTSGTLRGAREPWSALAELGADATALVRLRDHPNDDALVDVVVTTLGLPTQASALLRGRITVDDLPGAQHIERTSVGRVVWDRTHPTRPSIWTRIVRLVRGRTFGNDEGPGDRDRTGPS